MNLRISLLLFFSFILAMLIAITGGYFYFKTPPLSDAKMVQQARATLVLHVEQQNPEVAMSELKNDMQENKAVARSCHSLVHEIGEAAYKKYHDVAKALSYKNEMCGSGYFHGVIETYIGSTANLQDALQGICDGYTDVFDRANCYHGLGHGLMFVSNNNLPRALAQCDNYPDSKARIQCAEGVFMENFNTDLDDHPSAYLNQNDSMSICKTPLLDYQKATCYFYAPLFYLTVHPSQYPEAFAWCKTAEENFRDSCIKGVASRATKENIKGISYVENLCLSLAAADQSACAEGIGSYYTTEYANRKLTRQMCLTLHEPLQEACLKN